MNEVKRAWMFFLGYRGYKDPKYEDAWIRYASTIPYGKPLPTKEQK